MMANDDVHPRFALRRQLRRRGPEPSGARLSSRSYRASSRAGTAPLTYAVPAALSVFTTRIGIGIPAAAGRAGDQTRRSATAPGERAVPASRTDRSSEELWNS